MTIHIVDPIESLDFPKTVTNALVRFGILTVGDLLGHRRDEIWEIKDFGPLGKESVNSFLRRIVEKQIVIVDLGDMSNYNALMEMAPRTFFHIDGLYYRDVFVRNLGLGPIVTNSLKNEGYLWLSQIIHLDQSDLAGLPNMGKKTVKDALEAIGRIVLVLDVLAHENFTITPELIANKFRLEFNETMDIDLVEHFQAMIGFYRELFDEFGLDHDYLNDLTIRERLRQESYVRLKYQEFLFDSIRNSGYGLDLDMIIEKTPEVLRGVNYIRENVQVLHNSKKIRYLDGRTMVQNGPSFITGAKRHLSELQYAILMKYVEGSSIEAIASDQAHSWKWAVEHIEALFKSIKDADLNFAEDVYLELMLNYDISYKQFAKVVADPRIYRYLDLNCRYGANKYKNNRLPLEKIREDNEMPQYYKGLFSPFL